METINAKCIFSERSDLLNVLLVKILRKMAFYHFHELKLARVS